MALTCELGAHVCFSVEKMNVIFTSALLRSIGVHGDHWPLLTVVCRYSVCLPRTHAGVCRSPVAVGPKNVSPLMWPIDPAAVRAHLTMQGLHENLSLTLKEAHANKGRDSEQNERPRQPCPHLLCFKFPQLLMRTLVHAQCALLLSWQLHSPFAIDLLHVAWSFMW